MFNTFEFINTGAFLKLLKSLIISIAGFLTTWLIARYSNPDVLGQFHLILSTVAIVGILNIPGIKDSILQSVSMGYDSSLKIGTNFSLKIAPAVTFTLIVIGLYYLFNDQRNLFLSFLFLSVAYPLYLIFDNYFLYLSAKRLFLTELILQSIIQMFLVITLFIALEYSDNNIFYIVVAYFLSQLIFHIVFYKIFTNKIDIVETDDQLIEYGKYLTKINFLETLSKYADKIIVGILINPATLATYTIAIMVVDKTNNFLKPVFISYYSDIANDKIKITNLKIFTLLIISVISYIVYFFFIQTFLKIFFPNYLYESLHLAQIYGLGLIFLPVNTLMAYYFKAKKLKSMLTKFTIITKLSFIILLIPTIVLFNVLGLVILKSFFYFFELILYVVYFNGIKLNSLYHASNPKQPSTVSKKN